MHYAQLGIHFMNPVSHKYGLISQAQFPRFSKGSTSGSLHPPAARALAVTVGASILEIDHLIRQCMTQIGANGAPEKTERCYSRPAERRLVCCRPVQSGAADCDRPCSPTNISHTDTHTH